MGNGITDGSMSGDSRSVHGVVSTVKDRGSSVCDAANGGAEPEPVQGLGTQQACNSMV